jgi:hypothetical protein
MSNLYVFEDLLENKTHRFHYSPIDSYSDLSDQERIDALENQTKFREHLYKEYKHARTEAEKWILKTQYNEINTKIRDLLMSFHCQQNQQQSQ